MTNLEPPPGQDILTIHPEHNCVTLHIPYGNGNRFAVSISLSESSAQDRITAACVGEKMWERELSRVCGLRTRTLFEENGVQLARPYDAPMEHARLQALAWRRWGCAPACC